MPRLPYRPEHFGAYMGPAFTQVSELRFTWAELIRAAITVGRRNWSDVLRHGTYSVLETLWRVAIVRANLVQEPDGRLSQSDAFVGLDPSEKGAVSYFLGLAFTKLIAERLFGVPWLLHLDVYRQDLNPHLALTVRPDFVGMDARCQWIVAESKGRTSPVDVNALNEAKRQTRSLRNLNGQLPALRVAVGTYFSSGMVRARIWDPDDVDESALDLQIASEEFARAYYRPLIEVMDELPTTEPPTDDGRRARAVALSGLDAVLSVDEDIVAWYHGDGPRWESIVEARQTGPSLLERITRLRALTESDREAAVPHVREVVEGPRLEESSHIGLDGVSVGLGPSWDLELMQRQPEDRGL